MCVGGQVNGCCVMLSYGPAQMGIIWGSVRTQITLSHKTHTNIIPVPTGPGKQDRLDITVRGKVEEKQGPDFPIKGRLGRISKSGVWQ